MPKNQLKNQKEAKVEPTDDLKVELKNDIAPPPPSKKKKEKKSVRLNFKFFLDDRLLRVMGLFFTLFAVFLLFAFISYFFNLYYEWGTDEVFNMNISLKKILFNSDIEIHNWMGRMGAFLSSLAIRQGFGAGSFVFIILSFLYGIRLLLKISLLPIWKTTQYLIFCTLWLSFTIGYFSRNTDFSIFGGVFGYQLSAWSVGFVGNIGTMLSIAFSFLAFIIVVYNFSFRIPRKTKTFDPDPEENSIDTDEESDENEPITNQNIGTPLSTITDSDSMENSQIDDPILASESIRFNKNMVVDTPNLTDALAQGGNVEADAVERESRDILSIEKVAQPNTATQRVAFEIENTIISAVSDESDEIESQVETPAHYGLDTPFDPTLELSSFKFPSTDLLENHPESEGEVSLEEIESNKNRIINTLNNYQIQIDKIKATIGPTVTLYEIVPAPGVRISKIKNLEDDIALSLSALGIRIIAPIPGKGTIGIEVPNQKPQIVSMKTLLNSDKFLSSKFDLPIALGKTIQNEPFVYDLAKMPHLLMAGATGQGKSVGLNAIISSLLYKKHPSQLKFIMIDPKKVELTLYSKIERHYLAKLPDADEAIITDTKKVVRTLQSLTIEMDQRYDLLKDAQVRNLKEYNAKFISRKLNPNEGHRFLPYLVLVIDEFADLIMTAGKEVELPIARLAQLARAVGIHLIIATQRPSVNIITGTIKANFPARIAFRVSAKVDSRTILDQGGADQLIGRGDMLLSTGNELIRIQCAYIDTPEIEVLTEFIGSQRAYPSAHLLPECPEEGGEDSKDFDPNDKDELFEEAARVIVLHQQGSTSLLQRKLKLGYNRAGRLIDQLEAAGIVGAFEGSKAREVKIKTEFELEQFLQNKY